MIFACTNIFAQWSYKHFTDVFGDEQNDPYIDHIDMNGKFSNSATSSSLLIAKVLINYPNGDTLPKIKFCLYEYGHGPTVNYPSYVAFLYVKLSNNNVEKYPLGSPTGKGDIYLDRWTGSAPGWAANPFITHLNKEIKPLKCYIVTIDKYNTSTYNFIINPVGFSKAFSKIKPEKKEPIKKELEDTNKSENPILKKIEFKPVILE